MKTLKFKRRISRTLILFLFLFLLSLLYFQPFYKCSNDIKNLNEIKKFYDNLEIVSSNCNDNNINSDEDETDLMIKQMLLKSIRKPINVFDFDELKEREELHSALWKKLFGKYQLFTDDKELLSYKINLISNSSFLIAKNHTELEEIDQKLLATLHQSLYPWLYSYRYSSFDQVIKTSNGKGIVICTGNEHFKFARSTIDILRNVLHCSLPIEIFYISDNDLSKKNQKILKKFSNVYLSDITTYFDNDIINLYGWAIKPFAVLGSRFEEVILMDADVIFVRDPIELFNDNGYIKTGSLFFKDRTLPHFIYDGKDWLKTWMNNPLPETRSLRYFQGKSIHEMESGVVVVHKTKNILGLLNTCKLNENKIRDNIVYKFVHGDKETYWIGFDMARQHYNLDPEPSSVFGEFVNIKTVYGTNETLLCGHIGHSRNGNLLFWNGHLVKNKNNDVDKYNILNFEAFFIENENVEWVNGFRCLSLNDGKKPIILNDEEKSVLNQILEREKKYHFVVPKNIISNNRN